VRLSVTVNGEPREADGVWEGESLLSALREHLDLPGSKNACEQGECGSCSVYLDGELVCACLVLAAQAEGREVVTVEGLAGEGELHEVQRAFVEAGAVQCGFCTPGLIVASHDLLVRRPRPSDADIREALAGNLCRCTGYEKILDAVRLAAERLAAERPPGEPPPATEPPPAAEPHPATEPPPATEPHPAEGPL
jgi:aerobic carbon-monoxide dehydrogenase small subunit